MRGEIAIIRMRMAGYRPSNVWLLALDGKCPRSFFMDAENIIPNGGQAEVHIAGDDVVGTLDFRFLTGLTVLLQGQEKTRLRSIYARLMEFEPQRIIVSGDGVLHDYTAPEATA